ncbi:MAG: hypothetical protein SNJ57_04485 [Cyanobacteriota bacterium]
MFHPKSFSQKAKKTPSESERERPNGATELDELNRQILINQSDRL